MEGGRSNEFRGLSPEIFRELDDDELLIFSAISASASRLEPGDMKFFGSFCGNAAVAWL
jgi:hypothetical protein